MDLNQFCLPGVEICPRTGLGEIDLIEIGVDVIEIGVDVIEIGVEVIVNETGVPDR